MSVFKKGKNWYIDYYYNGRRIREKVGPSKKQAKDVLNKRKTQIAEKKFLDVKRNENISFSEFSNYFLENYSKVNKRSWKRDQLSIKHLKKFFGNKKLYEITPQDIENYKKKRLEDGVKHSTINRELACLKTMFNKAVEWEKLNTQPPKIKLYKVNNQRIRYLTSDEEKKLLELFSEPLKSIILIALNTGMRRGEIINLKWVDVYIKEGKIIIQESKSKEKRIIPMNEIVKTVFINLLSTGGKEYVFENKEGKQYGVDYITHCFNKVVKKAGIKDFRFHDLRHTFASKLVMRGVNLKVVQELLGHKDYKMTLRYSHLSPEVKTQAVKILENEFQMDTIWTPKEKEKKLKSSQVIEN